MAEAGNDGKTGCGLFMDEEDEEDDDYYKRPKLKVCIRAKRQVCVFLLYDERRL